MADMQGLYTPTSTSHDPYMKKIKQAEKDNSDLYARMDADKELYLLEPFVYRGYDGKKMDRVRNVTLNAPAVYAEQVKSTLSGANQQVVVEGILDDKANKVETFVNALFNDVDEAISDQGDAGLFPYMVEQAAIRGRLAARVVIVEGDDGTYVDVKPWDARFMVYKVKGRKLEFAAFKSYRSKEDLEEEYGIVVRKRKCEVWDYWDDKVNRVYADGHCIYEQAHDLGVVPVAIVVVPSGTGLRDQDAFKHQGESIFSLNRDLYPELNRIATIMQSLNEMYLRPAVQRASKAGEDAEPVTKYPYQSGTVWNVETEGGGFYPMPVADIHRATTYLHATIEQYLQRGALPSIDYGNLTFPLSAVALSNLGDKADKLYIPRLHALGMFYRQVAQLVILQMKGLEGGLDLGETGRKASFSFDNLDGEYSIKFQYFAQAPSQDIANHAVAAQAVAFLDEDTIRRRILKLQDPEGVKDRRLCDMAAAIDPVVGMLRMVHSLIDIAKKDDAKDVEARVLFEQVKILLRQRKQGQMAPPQQGAASQGPAQGGDNSLVPLLDGGQGGGGRRGPNGNSETQEVDSGKADA
ncbi:MAG: hypothetical protein JRE40_00915 [Deltaproteobacteria bacterium]|nr:hypothetical protein [Deltaproteobacteria bacterium]